MSISLRPAPFPETMAIQVDPTPVTAPRLVLLNEGLAEELTIAPKWLHSADGLSFLSGQAQVGDVKPVAQAYAGHQFGHFVPQLGDGRAHLLGVLTDKYGHDRDLQLKGSGPTPFSRRGDGRAALGPILREYIVSEAMAALKVPTTRALAAVVTGEIVWRDTPQQGAILTRAAASHLRVGTFQYFAARQDYEALKFLCTLAINRHYPNARHAEHPIRALFTSIIAAQARLIAQWMSLGFIHGVMNTDNMAISGETIDYGPCAFLDTYETNKVFSSIDHQGRYAYAAQPRLAAWNLARLAETLLPFFDPDEDRALAFARAALDSFNAQYKHAYRERMGHKLGLLHTEDSDTTLITSLLTIMEQNHLDWTLSFRRLARGEPLGGAALEKTPQMREWTQLWQTRLDQQKRAEKDYRALMLSTNPAIIPRNHRVAAALAAAEKGHFTLVQILLERVTHPFEDNHAYETPPTREETVRETFCGT